MKYLFKFWFIALSLIILSACSDDSATVRFKAITVLEVDGEVKEFYSVLQSKVERIEKGQSVTGFGGRSTLWDEATVIDLGERGRAYVVHASFKPGKSKSFSPIYPIALLRAFGSNATMGNLSKDDISLLANGTGRHPLFVWRDRKPTIIYFEDEADQNSIKYLQHDNLSDVFGKGVKIKEFHIEVTNEEITDGEILKYLPWLELPKYTEFQRAPNGIPSYNWEFVWHMTRTKFMISENLRKQK